MHTLFSQADLLHQVTLESDSEDWPSLARVSRSFFSVTAPLIWRDVEGVHNILALIPGIEIQLSSTSPKKVERMEIRNRHSRDLTRFNIYAPFVRSLEIYGENAKEYEIVNWKALAPYAKDTPLLPNLVRLTLTAPFSIKSRHQLFWIKMFLSPSLLDILVVRKPTGEFSLIHAPAAPSLLKHISELAPKTKRLSVYIEDDDLYRSDEELEMVAFWGPRLETYFKPLEYLRELTSTDAVLTPEVLPVIASLPNLEVLNVHRPNDGSMGVWESLDPESLPSNPFPALKHFSLCGTVAGEACLVLEYSLFSNLSSIQLTLDHYPTETELGPGNTIPWEYQLIEILVRACPHLTNLDLNLNESGHSVCNLRSPYNGRNALLLMSKLPLRTVCISSADFGLIDDSDIVTRHELGTAWPLVTKLSMPHLEAQFRQLYEFSQLPNLEELTLRLYLEQYSVDEGFFEEPVGCSSLHTLRGSVWMFFVECTIPYAAKVLLHCWPDLGSVEIDYRSGDREFSDEEGEDALQQQVDEINQEIGKLNNRTRKIRGRPTGAPSLRGSLFP